MPWFPVAEAMLLPEDGVREVRWQQQRFALCRSQGEWSLFDNTCPHLGAPLGQGTLVDGLLVCPWHYWSFDARSGRQEPHGACHLRQYPIEERAGQLFAQLEDNSAGTA
jgi:nitrite reductase (NADH) small subunit